jgi:hypothetical protein
MVGIVIGRSPRAGHLQTASVSRHGAPRLIERIKEIFGICSRAAHHYEELKPLSDEALAGRGLARADLPRAALRKLAGDA